MFLGKTFWDDQQVVVYCPECSRPEKGMIVWPYGVLLFEGVWGDYCEQYENHKKIHSGVIALSNENGRLGV